MYAVHYVFALPFSWSAGGGLHWRLTEVQSICEGTAIRPIGAQILHIYSTTFMNQYAFSTLAYNLV